MIEVPVCHLLTGRVDCSLSEDGSNGVYASRRRTFKISPTSLQHTLSGMRLHSTLHKLNAVDGTRWSISDETF